MNAEPKLVADDFAGRRYWHWYELPKAADGEGSTSNKLPVCWQVHTNDVLKNVADLVAKLPLGDEMKKATILAAEFHDLGKKTGSLAAQHR